MNDQFLGFAVIGNVRAAIAVEVGHHQRGYAFFRSDGFNAKTGIRRKFVDIAAIRRRAFSKIGVPRLVVEYVDLRTRVVGDHDIEQRAGPDQAGDDGAVVLVQQSQVTRAFDGQSQVALVARTRAA